MADFFHGYQWQPKFRAQKNGNISKMTFECFFNIFSANCYYLLIVGLGPGGLDSDWITL